MNKEIPQQFPGGGKCIPYHVSFCLSNKEHAILYPILMIWQILNTDDFFWIVDFDICKDLIQHVHTVYLTVAAVGFWALSSERESIYQLPIWLVCTNLKWCRRYITAQKSAIRLVNVTNFIRHWTPLSHSRTIADLSLVYIYFHGFCSSSSFSIMSQLFKPAGENLQFVLCHKHTVKFCTTKMTRFDRTWNWIWMV